MSIIPDFCLEVSHIYADTHVETLRNTMVIEVTLVF